MRIARITRRGVTVSTRGDVHFNNEYPIGPQKNGSVDVGVSTILQISIVTREYLFFFFYKVNCTFTANCNY